MDIYLDLRFTSVNLAVLGVSSPFSTKHITLRNEREPEEV